MECWAGAFTEETTFEDDDWRHRGGSDMSLKLFLPGIFQRNVQAVNKLKEIAEGLGKKLPHPRAQLGDLQPSGQRFACWGTAGFRSRGQHGRYWLAADGRREGVHRQRFR